MIGIRLQIRIILSNIAAMKKLVLCFCAALATFTPSCAPARFEKPEDQANKMHQHRIAPSEDAVETKRTSEGYPLPSASDSTWRF